MEDRAGDAPMAFALDFFCEIVETTKPESVSFLGGEPLLWSHLREAILFCRQRQIHTYVASNCALLTSDLARFFYEHGVSVIGKLNIGDPEDPGQLRLQSELIGSSLEGARRMIAGLFLLLSAGFRSPRLNVSNLIRKANAGYVGEFLQFCAIHEARPFLELSCNSNDLSREELEGVIRQVRQHYDGVLFPPHFMSSCWHFDNSLYFRANGDIQACSGNRTVLENCEEYPGAIERALSHPILATRREIVAQIVGPCSDCEMLNQCRGGCRAYAEQISLQQSYLKCWRIEDGRIRDDMSAG
jgi:radical SAM protein with 4Fe4S-binding SPASM domain